MISIGRFRKKGDLDKLIPLIFCTENIEQNPFQLAIHCAEKRNNCASLVAMLVPQVLFYAIDTISINRIAQNCRVVLQKKRNFVIDSYLG